jgi:putative endonuclease
LAADNSDFKIVVSIIFGLLSVSVGCRPDLFCLQPLEAERREDFARAVASRQASRNFLWKTRRAKNQRFESNRQLWKTTRSFSRQTIKVRRHGRRRPTIHEFLLFYLSLRDSEAMKGGWVYILTNRPNGTLYVGVTAGLARRVQEHRDGKIEGFTKRYGLKRLVYVERHDEIALAIQREKTVKGWRRAWKVRLIQEQNPDWHDLGDKLT